MFPFSVGLLREPNGPEDSGRSGPSPLWLPQFFEGMRNQFRILHASKKSFAFRRNLLNRLDYGSFDWGMQKLK